MKNWELTKCLIQAVVEDNAQAVAEIVITLIGAGLLFMALNMISQGGGVCQ